MATPKIWAKDGKGPPFIVETGVVLADYPYGRLFNPGDGIGPEVPVASIAHMMLYTHFEEYEGDPEPILAEYNEFLKKAPPTTHPSGHWPPREE